MATQHERALAFARRELGTREAPPHSNRGERVCFYAAHDFLPGCGYPWCVSFLLTCWDEGAGRPLPFRTASAFALYDWAKRVGWARPSRQCVPGDLIVWNVGAGHASMLERQGSDTLTTIDGNHADAVARAVRSRALVRGGIHVPEAAHPAPAVKLPRYFVVATSENGTKHVVFTHASRERLTRWLPGGLKRYGRNGITIRRAKSPAH